MRTECNLELLEFPTVDGRPPETMHIVHTATSVLFPEAEVRLYINQEFCADSSVGIDLLL